MPGLWRLGDDAAWTSTPMTKVDPELGTVRRCPRCEEWLPEDATFWYPRQVPRKDRAASETWYSYCRACYSERNAIRRAS